MEQRAMLGPIGRRWPFLIQQFLYSFLQRVAFEEFACYTGSARCRFPVCLCHRFPM